MKSALPLLLVLSLSLAACPQLPAPSGCTVHSYRCAPNPPAEPPGSHPEVCSASQRWTRIGDVGCQAIPPGTARCVVEEGLAFCANPAPSPPLPSGPVPSAMLHGRPSPAPALAVRPVGPVQAALVSAHAHAAHAVRSALHALSL